MKKTKEIIVLILVFSVILGLSNFAFAADTEEITYTREFPTTNGSITLKLANLTLDTDKQYEFTLVASGDTPTNWILMPEFNENTATINLNAQTESIKNVLKVTNTGYLYVREKNNTESFVVENMKIDLKIPYIYASGVFDDGSNVYEFHSPYGMGRAHSYALQKITDKEFIEQYLDIKNNNKSIYQMENIIQQYEPLQEGYTTSGLDMLFGPTLLMSISLPGDGLYIMWVRHQEDNFKTIYGAWIYDGKKGTQLSDYISTNGNQESEGTENQENTNPGEQSNSANDTSNVEQTQSKPVENTPKETISNQKQDTTTASGKIPYTGVDMKIIAIIIFVSILGIITYVKYRKFKNI